MTGSKGDQICCSKDTVVSPCFNPCKENTCANLKNSSSSICLKDCVLNVCVCKGGLFRNECNECVPEQDCTKPCALPKLLECTGQFETLYGCLDPTQARVCLTSRCSKPRDFLLKYALQSNQKGLCAPNTCDCIDGYLRNKCGQCVPANECGRKCCVGKLTPCSGPNEVRRKKLRKCKERTCKNLQFPMKCKGRAGRVRKNVCDCKKGYWRNECGKCVTKDKCNDNSPCVCTNSCVGEGREMQCFNRCMSSTCKNYYELPHKSCPKDCNYVCACSKRLNMWYNGTACVPGDQCPPYEIARDIKYIPLSAVAQP